MISQAACARHKAHRKKNMYFSEHERLALFIDGANLYAASKALDLDIDFQRLLAVFQRKTRLVRALYYTALVEDNEYSSVRPLKIGSITMAIRW